MGKIRMATTFSGIGMQERGVYNSGVFDEVEVVATCETDTDAIISYAAIHNGLTMDMVDKYEEYPSREEMAEYLANMNIGYDWQKMKPYDWQKIARSKDGKKLLQRAWLSCKLNNNVGDICLVNNFPSCDLFTYSSPCFVEGTLVLTQDGYKEIQNITKSDCVIVDGHKYQVINTFDNGIHDVFDLTFEDGFVCTCTPNHKFLVDRSGYQEWVEAYKLTSFDEIVTDDNSGAYIKNKSNYRTENVYDIEVDIVHRFQLRNGAIVHNCTDYSIAGSQAGTKVTCKDCGHEFNPLDYDVDERYSCPNCGSVNITSTRSGLMKEVERIILDMVRENRAPKYLLQENVDALVSKKFMPDFQNWIGRLDRLGYNTYWTVMNAKYCSTPEIPTPQNRKRVFSISIRKDVDNGKFTWPLQFDSGIRLKDILFDEVDEKYYINNEKAEQLKKDLILNGTISLEDSEG